MSSGLGAALVLSALLASPAAAAATKYQPDGWVRYYAYWDGYDSTWIPNPPAPKAYIGNNIYNTTGNNQTVTKKFSGAPLQGDYFVFQVVFENDGTTSDRFKIKGPGSQYFRYYSGTTDITSAVNAGTYKTPLVAPGGTRVIAVWAQPDAGGSRLITATSVGQPTKKDAVKIVIKVSACGC
jgi:hypothetical protein